MKKENINIMHVVGLIIGLYILSYTASADTPVTEKYITDNHFIKKIMETLDKKKRIGAFTGYELVFVYHEDNRCDGSTEGVITLNPGNKIDSAFTVEVVNDGKGWACATKPPTKFNIKFNLKTKLDALFKNIKNEYDPGELILYVYGDTESDYIKLHLKKESKGYRVYKIEYRSEDPG
ncbi:hypothetical protein MNBD_GAMMA09-3856 [hydrothermal vent metagenome]|uniref:Uncharacterized protein n=1 Tax=hydrothermal vent metagenome TaxID=652676 RepID=A0A3B0XIW9_9ZZZZ